MSSYIGHQHNERIISYVIVECDSNEKQFGKFEHPSKKGAKAGSCTLVSTMKRMVCNPYTNWLSEVESCVFERFVIFAIRKNDLAFYVQKLR